MTRWGYGGRVLDLTPPPGVLTGAPSSVTPQGVPVLRRAPVKGRSRFSAQHRILVKEVGGGAFQRAPGLGPRSLLRQGHKQHSGLRQQSYPRSLLWQGLKQPWGHHQRGMVTSQSRVITKGQSPGLGGRRPRFLRGSLGWRSHYNPLRHWASAPACQEHQHRRTSPA